MVGWGAEPGGAGCGPDPTPINTYGTVKVYVEIYDDSSSPCLLITPTEVPASGGNASYDARYYSTEANGLNVYEVYYEVPGSNNIQNLAYAELKAYSTAEIAAGEASYDTDVAGSNDTCPTLGLANQNLWNHMGQTVPNTFAGPLNLYQGGQWKNWTTSVAQTYGGYSLPSGGNPYLINQVSNWSAGDYIQFEFGGPQS